MEKGEDSNYSWYYINNQGKWEFQDGPRVLQLEQYVKNGQQKFKTKADNWDYEVILNEVEDGVVQGTQRNIQTGKVRQIKRVVAKGNAPSNKKTANITNQELIDAERGIFPLQKKQTKVSATKKASTEKAKAKAKTTGHKQKKVEKKKEKKNKKRKESFALYLYKILKQVHPNLGISKNAMNIMNQFIYDTFERIMVETQQLMRIKKQKTLQSQQIQTALKLILQNGELYKHAVAEGTKAVTKFMSSTDF